MILPLYRFHPEGEKSFWRIKGIFLSPFYVFLILHFTTKGNERHTAKNYYFHINPQAGLWQYIHFTPPHQLFYISFYTTDSK